MEWLGLSLIVVEWLGLSLVVNCGWLGLSLVVVEWLGLFLVVVGCLLLWSAILLGQSLVVR